MNYFGNLLAVEEISTFESETVINYTEFKMSYNPWSIEKTLLTKHQFCEFDDFLSFLRTSEILEFHIKANRARIRALLEDLKSSSAPFNRTKRFPENELYVHLNDAGLKTWINQIMHSMDLPDRALERSQLTTTEFTLSDAKRSFNKAFENLSKIMDYTDIEKLASNGVYNRTTFERNFDLNWV